jgi:hypothetical protein
MSRRESVGRLTTRTQSASGPPVQDTVSVAVLPPRLRAGMAPPTGIAPAGAFSWDEAINWQHNEPENEEPAGRRKSFLRKAGLTTQRHKLNPDTPPFVLRQVPYETWRKHYAKDKDGNYRGTHAPAEDCLLKPDDVQKWRLGDPVTKGDRWTRGREALPVYAEIQDSPQVPTYEYDYDGPPRTDYPVNSEPDSMTLDPEDDRLVAHMAHRQRGPNSSEASPAIERSLSATSFTSQPPDAQPSTQIIADGKTAAEIIAEAKAKPVPKLTWKQRLGKATEYTIMGS